MKSGIEGTAKVMFGGKIQISCALNKKTHNPCILFNELPHEKNVGEFISDEELAAVCENPKVVFEFNDTHSVDIVRTALYMVEEQLRKNSTETAVKRKTMYKPKEFNAI